jgi:uncharacterized protein (DUF488 family)
MVTSHSDNLAYFLKTISGTGYVHEPLLAPTEEIMTAFNEEKGDQDVFRKDFMGLMAERQVESHFRAEEFDGACLLCSEDKPHRCHRTLVCDYLNGRWGGKLSIRHI